MAKLWGWFVKQSKVFKFSTIGFLIGGVFGLFFGGIGIAARGGAFGVAGWLLFGSLGAFAGYKLARRKI